MSRDPSFDEQTLRDFNDLLDGNIDPARGVELERRLLADPELRKAYVGFAEIHARLAIVVSRDAEPLPVPAPTASRVAGRINPAFWAIAAMLMLAATISIVTVAIVLSRPGAPTVAPRPGAPIAVFTGASDVLWLDEPMAAGDEIAPRLISMGRGQIELALHGGATVRATDEATFELVSASKARLLHGRLWSRITSESGSLEVRGPNFSVVDLGTEFGVEVARDGSSQVHVFDGSVLLSVDGRPNVKMTAGDSVRIESTGEHRSQTMIGGTRQRFMGLPEGLIHHWTFDDGTPRDTVGSLDVQLHGGAAIVNGALVLDGVDDYAITDMIERDLAERTLVARVGLANLRQQAGGVLMIEQPRGDEEDIFDGAVYAEFEPRIWANGSNYGHRSVPAEAKPIRETSTLPTYVTIAITYRADGAVTIYRDGEPIAAIESAGLVTYPAGSSRLLLGLRHSDRLRVLGDNIVLGPEGNDAFLAGAIDQALVFNRALSDEQVYRLNEQLIDTTNAR